MNTQVVKHRFANQDYNYSLRCSSVSIQGRNYYSYSTVFGQWVGEKVCLVYHGNTSVTSHKHQIPTSYFPQDVVVLPYDDGGGLYSWHGCQLLTWSGDTFDYRKRIKLINYYVGMIKEALTDICGTKKDADKRAAAAISENWAYITKLCQLYKDTTMKKWLKEKGTDKQMRKAVRLMVEGVFDVKSLTDATFGEGTFDKYWTYSERFRKADKRKNRVINLSHRLGFTQPAAYGREWGSNMQRNPFTPQQMLELTAKERNEWHFSNLWKNETEKRNDDSYERYARAFRWIIGKTPMNLYETLHKATNKDNGEVYNLKEGYNVPYWVIKGRVSFEYEDFRKSAKEGNREQWIQDFYAKCKAYHNNLLALKLLTDARAEKQPKANRWDDDRYIISDSVHEEYDGTPEMVIIEEFIRQQEVYFHDKEVRERAERIERERQKAEREAEKKRMEEATREQINAHLEQGAEGCRDLWRDTLTSISEAVGRFNEVVFHDDGDFYYGGNVLLRLNLTKTEVQTSKNICIPVEVAKKIFSVVKAWHYNPKSFKQTTIDTKRSGRYTATSFDNDILTCGCHRIAFCEMERMYDVINEICK